MEVSTFLRFSLSYPMRIWVPLSPPAVAQALEIADVSRANMVQWKRDLDEVGASTLTKIVGSNLLLPAGYR